MVVLSLFGGMECGRIAFNDAEINISKYYSSEINKYAKIVAMANFSDIIQLGDITKWKEWDIEQPDIITAGFPCQPYSIAGKRKGLEDYRGGNIVDCMFGVIEKCKPGTILLENVKGLLSIDNGNIFKNILKTLNNIGYAVDWIIINSALVSAQNRERIYIVGKKIEDVDSYEIELNSNNKRNIQPSFFSKSPRSIIVFDSGIEQPEDQKIYLKDIIEDATTEREKSHCLDANYYKGASYEEYKNKSRRQLVYINTTEKEVEKRKTETFQQDKIRTLNNITKAGCLRVSGAIPMYVAGAIRGRNPENPKSREAGIKTEQQLELRKDEKTNCLTSVQKDNVIVNVDRCLQIGEANIKGNDQIKRVYSPKGKSPGISTCQGGHREPKISTDNITWRKLTPMECERLQTVPDNYTNHVSNSQRYKMLGNGWTIKVISHILNHIKKMTDKSQY